MRKLRVLSWVPDWVTDEPSVADCVIVLVVGMTVDPSLRLDRIGIHPIPLTCIIKEVRLSWRLLPMPSNVSVIRNVMRDNDISLTDFPLKVSHEETRLREYKGSQTSDLIPITDRPLVDVHLRLIHEPHGIPEEPLPIELVGLSAAKHLKVRLKVLLYSIESRSKFVDMAAVILMISWDVDELVEPLEVSSEVGVVDSFRESEVGEVAGTDADAWLVDGPVRELFPVFRFFPLPPFEVEVARDKVLFRHLSVFSMM